MAMRLLTLLGVRLAFAKGLTERTVPMGGDMEKSKYNAKFIVPRDHPQYAEIERAFVDIAQEGWGQKNWKAILSGIKDSKQAICFRDGSKTTWDGFAGNMFLSLTNNDDHGTTSGILILRPDKTVISDLSEVRRLFYSGCYVNIKCAIYSPKNGAHTIHGVLKVVQFAKHGESLEGGRVDGEGLPELAYEPVTDTSPMSEDAPTPTGTPFEGF